MSHSDHIQDEKASTCAAGSACGKTGKPLAIANNAAADAFAASLKPILLELLIAPSDSKRMTPTGWKLSEIAKRLNGRGLRTRTGKLFRPMTVKRLLERVPDVVEAARAARQAKADAVFRHFLGIEPPTSVTEAIAGMNKLLATCASSAPKT